jgi:hypothetical protein
MFINHLHAPSARSCSVRRSPLLDTIAESDLQATCKAQARQRTSTDHLAYASSGVSFIHNTTMLGDNGNHSSHVLCCAAHTRHGLLIQEELPSPRAQAMFMAAATWYFQSLQIKARQQSVDHPAALRICARGCCVLEMALAYAARYITSTRALTATAAATTAKLIW